MIKQLITFITAVILVTVITYSAHLFILQSTNLTLNFSLLSVYLFHSIAAILVYSTIVLIAYKIPNQAGYAYLASVLIKMGFFVLIFNASIFSIEILNKQERFSLVIPLFVFLILEAISVSKLLNSK